MNIDNICGKRLRQLREDANMSLRDLSKLIGIGYATIGKYERGDVVNLKQSTIARLAEVFNVRPSYLMGYDLLDAREIPAQGTLPVIGMASAGKGVIASEDILWFEQADEKYCNSMYFYLQVTGDSMSPKIDDGDLVLVHRQTSVDSGSIGVFIVDGEQGYVKKVEYDKEYIHLLSFNPYYPPMVFEGPDVLRVYVVGRVMEMKRKL